MGRREVLEVIEAARGQTTVFMSTTFWPMSGACATQWALSTTARSLPRASIEALRERYAVPVFVIEFEAAPEQMSVLANHLQQQPWVASAEARESRLRLYARDLAYARQTLPPLVIASGITLLHYELTAPSLEDVFVHLTSASALTSASSEMSDAAEARQ